MASSQDFATTSAANEDFPRYIYPHPQDYITRLPDELKLNVTQRLSIGDLGRLAQTSRLFYDFITPILYTRDNRDKYPRAIFWAASVDPDKVPNKNILAVLDFSIEYGGNPNAMYVSAGPLPFRATPLHLAAASGKLGVVKKLLRNRADPNALGKGFLYNMEQSLDHGAFDVRMENIGRTIALSSRFALWRPLFVPFVLGHEGIIQALLRYGASPVLAVTDPDRMGSDPEPGSINILHILASQHEREHRDATGLSYFSKYRNLINVPVPRGEAPLSIALRHRNLELIRDIVVNGGDIEGVSELGTTPLIQAITCFYKERTTAIRKAYMELIRYLVEDCNAHVGKHPNDRVYPTPLTCAVTGFGKALQFDWKDAVEDICSIITLLLKRGANINEQSNDQYTALNVLCYVICQRKNTDKLIDLFEKLVIHWKADINAHFPSGGSILGYCILKLDCKPKGFFTLLLKLDAKLSPDEINPVFKIWVSNRSLRNIKPEFNMLEYSKAVTQDSIDFAYRACLNCENKNKIWDQLQRHFPDSIVPQEIAAEAFLRDDSNKRFAIALGFKNFDGGYIHTDGHSFLHLIVNRLERFQKYTASQAISDAKKVLRSNASVTATDNNGRTALDKLVSMRREGVKSYDPLRLLLHDIEREEKLLWKEYEDKKLSAGEFEHKCKELIKMYIVR